MQVMHIPSVLKHLAEFLLAESVWDVVEADTAANITVIAVQLVLGIQAAIFLRSRALAVLFPAWFFF